MKCNECGWVKKGKGNEEIEDCPKCGGALEETEFVLQDKDILIHDEKGKEIAIGIEKHGGYRLRMRGWPVSYLPNFESILKHVRKNTIALNMETEKSLEGLVKAEEDATEFMKEFGNKLKDKMKELYDSKGKDW